MEEATHIEGKEQLNPHSIAIATTTFYPGWYSGETKGLEDVDKIRGDLFIKLAKETQDKGFQLAVIDGGSSDAFTEEVKEMGVDITSQKEKGMSASRREVFIKASKLDGVKVISWIEPEKVSIIRDNLPFAVLPILQGSVEIVVPKRSDESFATYPAYQVSYEKRANLLWNKILISKGLLPVNQELDVWFGPKFFANKPKVLALFLRKYEYRKSGSELDKKVEPEQWANSIFIPIAAALQKGMRVASVDVHYEHPEIQFLSEKDDEKFKEKRELQLRNIIISTIHYIRLSESNPKSKLREIE